jgi:hypothetical protein
MAEQKSKDAKSNRAFNFLLRLKKAFDGEKSELEKSLLFYETGAVAILCKQFMADDGSWLEGYDAETFARCNPQEGFIGEANINYLTEYEKLKPLERVAVRSLIEIRKCRESINKGNIEDALLYMETLVLCSRSMKRKRSQAKGGKKPKSIQTIKTAVSELLQGGYKSAHAMWAHLKTCSLKGKPYETIDGSVNFIRDNSGIRPGYMSGNEELPYITFRTFQGYVSEAKKRLSK